MAEFLLDSEVESLACVYTPKTLDLTVENGAFVHFQLGSGKQGTVRVAFNQPRGGLESTLTNLGYEIFGTNGVVRGYGTLSQLSGNRGEPIEVRLEIDRFEGTRKVDVDQVQNIYQAVISRHARSILEDAPMDAAEALHNLDLILACYRSADLQGKTIRL
jgi:predicted dehydrogenase